MNLKVSIIVPVYNGKNYVKPTLFACECQKYNNLEVIIIDDCSTDGSYEFIQNILDNFQQRNKFSLFKNRANLGFLRTVNKGVELSSGDCLLFLGQDDVLPPEYLTIIMKKYNNDVSFVFCNPVYIDKNGVEGEHIITNPEMMKDSEVVLSKLTKECIIPSTGLIINAKNFRRVGMFDTKYRNYGEWNLWIKLAQVGKISYCEETYSCYRRHEQNMTNSFVNKNKRKELIRYWNECRKLALKTLPLSNKDRIEAKLYYVFINAKEIIKNIFKRYTE